VILQYASAESGDVLISLRANGQTMQSKVVSIVPSQDLMPLFVSFQNEIILNPGIQYDLFIQKLGVWKKDEPKIAVGKNDPYGCGELLRNGVSANIDLTFEILTSGESPESNNVFDAFPEHECSIAQRNFNTTKSFSGDRLVQELQFCTDGIIEGIYFAGSISTNLENVEIAITNQKGSIISQGQLTAIEGVADLLKAQFSPFQVVNVQDYWIEILVPSSETLELIGSTDSRHQITGMLLNEEPFDFAPIHAVGMKPFNFNFIEAAEEKEIEVSCFPNPFLNDFNVRVSPFEGEDLHIMVYDYMGVLMFEDWMQPSTESQTVNVMTNIPFKKGFQTVRIEHGSQVYLKTVIKQ
ncbi:MAG: T9SS type A sorting domain-containing protein, partial [Flavobacteriales bacterium]|nr:T9SS type A sorting domain-containing protein [Flavobacteriales bacterium]